MPTSADQLADLPLNELLARVAARTPAPGGGSAVAVVCSLAAGLVEMAARFGDHGDDTIVRAGRLGKQALALAEAELAAYAPVIEAQRLAPDDPGRDERVRRARSSAADLPLEIAELGAELAAMAAQSARAGHHALAGDAIAAALLAEAACRAAAELVVINLSDLPGDGRVTRAGELSRAAARARDEALASGARRRGR